MITLQQKYYSHLKEPLFKYSKKYGYSMRTSWFRMRIYNMFDTYKKTHDVQKLVNSAVQFRPSMLDIYAKKFIKREIDIAYKIYFEER